jgi:nucleoside-diphosphate-sugar epimerase
VKDTARGFVELAKCESAIGEEVNIATGYEVSIRDLANKIITQINPEAKIVEDGARIRPEKSEVERLLGCPKKLYRLTGWKPEISLVEGLGETIAWFRVSANRNGYKADLYHI